MSCGALVLHSLALIAHATFLVPSVVAVPCEPLLESSTQPEVWISGPQDKRNGVRVGTMFQPLSVGVHAQFAAYVELVAAAKTQECLAADAGTARSRVVHSKHIGVMKDGTFFSVPMLESDARSSSSPSAELALPPQLSLPSLKLDQGLEPDLADHIKQKKPEKTRKPEQCAVSEGLALGASQRRKRWSKELESLAAIARAATRAASRAKAARAAQLWRRRRRQRWRSSTAHAHAAN